MLPSLDPLLSRSPEARTATLEVLAWVMGADGELRREELAVIEDLARRLDLRWRPPLVPSWSEAWVAPVRPVGPLVLQLACLLATADGDLSPAELDCLELLRGALGLDRGAVDALCTWAQEGHRWAHKGESLLHEVAAGGFAPAGRG